MLMQMSEKDKFFFKLHVTGTGTESNHEQRLSRSMEETKNTPARVCVEYGFTSIKF